MVAKLTQTEAKNIIIAAGFEPLEPYTNSVTPWKCIHLACGQIRFPLLDKIRQGQRGCRDCSYKANAKERLRSQSSARDIAKKHNLLPLEEYKGAHQKWVCKCLVCGTNVSPRINDIQRGIGGCWKCGKKKQAKTITTKEVVAVQAMLIADFEPQEPYIKANLPWKCKCLKCGTIVYPALTAVKAGGGCSYCAIYGFQKDKPAYLYLVTHHEYNSHKVGIGNTRPDQSTLDRLHKLTIKKWMIYKKWNFTLGVDASRVEKEVFRILRQEHGIKSFLDKKQMPVTGGHTETVDADSITLLQLEKIINKVIRGMKNG